MQKIHLKSPGNWINDPNGFIYYKGNYHLFYQYFPYGLRWGTMHWGHAISKDLVHWKHKKIALFPSKYEDRNGCFSGCAIEHKGKMIIFYTGVRYIEENPDDIHLCIEEKYVSTQMIIESEDGLHFDNIHRKQVIIPPIEDDKIGNKTHTRDPKVWRGKDDWFLVVGSCTEDFKGKLLIYKSKDLYHWSLENHVTKRDGFGWGWECPDYFTTDGGNVLVISAMGVLKDGKKEENNVICCLADFDEEACAMHVSDQYQFLDYGFDLYASQSIEDEAGRRVLIAWLRMPEPVDGKWIGMYCIPRVVEVENEHVYFRVHPNVKKEYTRRINAPIEAGEAGYCIELNLEDGESINVGGYHICRCGMRIFTDRSSVFMDGDEYRKQFQTPVLSDGCQLTIYVEQNLIEIFVNNGEYVISNTVYNLRNDIQLNSMNEIQIYTTENAERM